jgi:hypothetical protein
MRELMRDVVDVLSSAGCLAVSATLLTAGVVKCADRRSFADTLDEFGLPNRSQASLSWVIPVVEVTLAICLLVPRVSREAAVGALALLSLFGVVLQAVGRRPAPPACGCFGGLGRRSPVDRRSVLRTWSLAAVAGGAAVWGSDNGVAPLLSGVGGWRNAVLAASLAAFLLCAVVAGVLLRRYGAALHRIRHLEALVADTDGLRKSAASVAGARGRRADAVFSPAAPARLLSDLGYPWIGDAKRCLVVFVSRSCPSCTSVLGDLLALQPHLRSAGVKMVILAGGDPTSVEAWRRELGFATSFVLDTGEAVHAFGIPGTPAALELNSAGSVRSGPVVGPKAVIELAREVLQAAAEPHGSPVPAARLQTPDAGPRSVAEGVPYGRLG